VREPASNVITTLAKKRNGDIILTLNEIQIIEEGFRMEFKRKIIPFPG